MDVCDNYSNWFTYQITTYQVDIGTGQDSKTILLKLVFDAVWRSLFAPGKLVIMMADTGDEHEETLIHVQHTKRFCKEHGIEFVHITPDMGFHRKSWQGLREHYVEYAQIGSKTFTKSCTESLKLATMGNFMDDWIGKRYGYPSGRKRAIKRYVKEHGHKIVNLIGIAQGEERRMQDQSKQPDKWRRECIDIRYPLIEFGLDRAGCQDYMRRIDEVVPLPSNCILCVHG